MTWREALHRPAPGRNSVWDLVPHLTYVRHRLLGRVARLDGRRVERFPRRMRAAWFPTAPPDPGPRSWREELRALADSHERLVERIDAASDASLARRRPGKGRSIGEEILGLAIHDAYHAGQIRLLAKLARAARLDPAEAEGAGGSVPGNRGRA